MAKTSINVLLVEDTDTHAQFISKQLDKSGNPKISTTLVGTLAAALEHLAGTIPFDIVLLDLGLPDSRGLATLRSIVTKAPQMPVIVITATDSDSEAVEAISDGATDYLVKDNLNSLQIKHRINLALERHRLENSSRKLWNAIEQANDAILITDTGGIIEYANPSLVALTGYSNVELIGSKPNILKSGSHENHFYQKLWDTIKAGDNWHGELVNKKKSGALYNQVMTISPVKGPDGSISNFVAIMRDITLHKQTESKLEEAIRREERWHKELDDLKGSLYNHKSFFDGEESPVTARMMGLHPLRTRSPNAFAELETEYESLLDRYLEAAAMEEIPPRKGIFDLVDKIGDYTCGPRDVIELHMEAVTNKSKDVSPSRAKVYTIEGRLLALEVMGNLVDYYRRGGRPKGSKSKTP